MAAEMIAALAHFSQGSGICPCQISGYTDLKVADILFENMEIPSWIHEKNPVKPIRLARQTGGKKAWHIKKELL
jgi:hypothetical protein